MKANLPKKFRGGGQSNPREALHQAQVMQKKMEELISELSKKEYVVSSGGGMIKVTLTGDIKVKSIEIDPEVVNKDDISMLEDIVVAGVNEAISVARSEKDKALEELSGSADISGMLGML